MELLLSYLKRAIKNVRLALELLWHVCDIRPCPCKYPLLVHVCAMTMCVGWHSPRCSQNQHCVTGSYGRCNLWSFEHSDSSQSKFLLLGLFQEELLEGIEVSNVRLPISIAKIEINGILRYFIWLHQLIIFRINIRNMTVTTENVYS